MKLMLSAGDPSGDLYGALLISELRRRTGAISFAAVGGPLMRRALGKSDCFIRDLASEGVVGFIEPLKKVPMYLALLRDMKKRMADIDALVCIDFYGFNRQVIRAAKALGIPVYYFISPQVWASRPGRVQVLKRCVRRMLVIFPFEEELYRKAGVPVSWVGHPLLDLLPTPRRQEPAAGRAMKIGLLPGSRPAELKRHLPVMLRAVTRILKDFPMTEVAVFASPQLPDAAYQAHLSRWRAPRGVRARLVREADYAERARQDFILTSSGTATLENALLGLPMVVIYKLSWPTYFLARALVRVPYIAMANILAGRRLVPELIQADATPGRIALSALEYLGDRKKLRGVRDDLLGLREKLGGGGAVARAADILIKETAAAPRRGLVRA